MEDTTKIPLVSSEISGIWNSYMDESVLVCILKYFSNRVDDYEIRTLMQEALNLSSGRVSFLKTMFNQENLPVPQGFNESDVDINAPRLFTDTFYLKYLEYVTRVAIRSYTLVLSQAAREDIRGYFSNCTNEYVKLYNKTAELSLSRGVFTRSPHVEVPREVQFIKNQSFMVNILGKKRALLTDEITYLFAITNDTVIRKALVAGFLQVCKDKKVKEYLSKVMTLAEKQNGMFNSILIDENIPAVGSSESYVTNSTVSPFSDKLILAKLLVMYSVKITSMGTALALTKRSDLKSTYLKGIDDAMEYAKDGADIMIENGWMEQPPQAIKSGNLVGV